jgi:hypothetical protein
MELEEFIQFFDNEKIKKFKKKIETHLKTTENNSFFKVEVEKHLVHYKKCDRKYFFCLEGNNLKCIKNNIKHNGKVSEFKIISQNNESLWFEVSEDLIDIKKIILIDIFNKEIEVEILKENINVNLIILINLVRG